MKEKSYRMEKVNTMLKKEISDIISQEYEVSKENFITVSVVDTKADLSQADVYISALKDEDLIIDALNRESGHIRYILGKRIRIKKTPKLIFKKDIYKLNI
ncbi:MAG: 30S ribosome-binding factor RbfA [Sulfurihydrogenibium sp.]|jgi:ribosome-binding factor A|uniref:30S ribosome-binding factor RbfA n=1 Tax=Sulfurihydrogenibium sp. TaxID=2053621 RepID=UPI000CAC7B71|nr:MAG: 30S ribosome-binding factor RbfA [Sulfurihydrogenibium sp.]PMP76192.1 MAG: 30S ribosome-binding factor RbfA [Sulfurihydrogenibium sp.]